MALNRFFYLVRLLFWSTDHLSFLLIPAVPLLSLHQRLFPGKLLLLLPCFVATLEKVWLEEHYRNSSILNWQGLFCGCRWTSHLTWIALAGFVGLVLLSLPNMPIMAADATRPSADNHGYRNHWSRLLGYSGAAIDDGRFETTEISDSWVAKLIHDLCISTRTLYRITLSESSNTACVDRYTVLV